MQPSVSGPELGGTEGSWRRLWDEHLSTGPLTALQRAARRAGVGESTESWLVSAPTNAWPLERASSTWKAQSAS